VHVHIVSDLDIPLQNLSEMTQDQLVHHSIVPSGSLTANLAPVFCLISSTPTPGATSIKVRPPFFRSTSNTACMTS
jgi:hypothetical protein